MIGIGNDREEVQREENLELFCDVLVITLLVETVLGDCPLLRELGAALDDGSRERLAAAWQRFDRLPDELRSRILDGDAGPGAAPGEQPGTAAAARSGHRTA